MHRSFVEIWKNINSPIESIRSEAEIQWQLIDQQRGQKFENAKKHLPALFVKEYTRRHGFHDYTFSEITIYQSKKQCSCNLTLSNGAESVRISLNTLRRISIDIATFESCILGELRWGYCVIDITPEHKIDLSIICDTENHMHFELDGIGIEILD